jgi:hypothetical protein
MNFTQLQISELLLEIENPLNVSTKLLLPTIHHHRLSVCLNQIYGKNVHRFGLF